MDQLAAKLEALAAVRGECLDIMACANRQCARVAQVCPPQPFGMEQ